MFIGHHAAALAGKRAAPRVGLGTLVFATSFLDLIWPLFVLMGLEQFRVDPGNTAVTDLAFDHYPISHSLLMTLMWSVIVGGGYLLWKRDGRGALVVGVAVLSHWVLDFVSHAPDMPIGLNGPKVGLGLWNSMAMTIVVETILFAIALWLYLRTTRARNRTGSIALWAWVIFLAVVNVMNMQGVPPDAKPRDIAIGALAAYLFVPWAWWIDRNREARG